MSTKIEGFVSKNFESRLGAGGLPSFCNNPAHHHYVRPSTIVIHDDKPERVFTEDEVKAMLDEMGVTAQLGQSVDKTGNLSTKHIVTVAAKYGLTLP